MVLDRSINHFGADYGAVVEQLVVSGRKGGHHMVVFVEGVDREIWGGGVKLEILWKKKKTRLANQIRWKKTVPRKLLHFSRKTTGKVKNSRFKCFLIEFPLVFSKVVVFILLLGVFC